MWIPRSSLYVISITLTFLFYFMSFFLVDVLLKAVGDTPIMKTKKWALPRGRTVQSVSQFISRYLKLGANEQLVSVQFILLLLHFLASWYVEKPKISTMPPVALCILMPEIISSFFPKFIYVNQSFAPSPDIDVGVLFDVSTHAFLIYCYCIVMHK